MEIDSLLYAIEYKSGIDQLPKELSVFKIGFAIGKVDDMNIPRLRTWGEKKNDILKNLSRTNLYARTSILLMLPSFSTMGSNPIPLKIVSRKLPQFFQKVH
jgi:hypothetical protein